MSRAARRLVEALDLEGVSDDWPLEIGDRGRRYTVYVWTLRRSLPRGRRRLRVRVPDDASHWGSPARATLLLGYAPDLDVFVAWSRPARHRRLPWATLTVREQLLRDAEMNGRASEKTGDAEVEAVLASWLPQVFDDLPELEPDVFEVGAEFFGSGPASGGGGGIDFDEPAAWRPDGPSPPLRRKPPPILHAPPAQASSPPEPEEVVNTGFMLAGGEPVLPWGGLERGRAYVFFVEVGAPMPYSLEQTPTPLPREHLDDDAVIDVVLFSFPGELELEPGRDTGRFALLPEGGIRVLHSPVALDGPRVGFPVTTPDRDGTLRLRCNLYCRGVLVQSRLITAEYAEIVSTLEYSLSRSLRGDRLAALPPADLSVMVNGDGARHQLRIYAPGAPEPLRKQDAEIDDTALQAEIDACRSALRRAAWGTVEEWREADVPRYGDVPDDATLRADLIDLARRGRTAFLQVSDALAGGGDDQAVATLREQLAGHRRIEIAAHPDLFIPAAMFYDAPLLTGDPREHYTLCAAFTAALAAGDLLGSPCFDGACPSQGELLTVCPSGFWGFRHAIGWPVSDADADLPPVLDADGEFTVGAAFAERLLQAQEHRGDVEALLGPVVLAADRTALYEMLKTGEEPLIYLYCHGGVAAHGPAYVEIGRQGDPYVTGDDLELLAIAERRGLVFINGCRTTAVSPRERFNLVSRFVRYAKVAGVVGTEITVFEPMASVFGLAFLDAFVRQGESLGESIRRARLALLQQRNPLGLAYVPFGLGGLRLVRSG